MCDRAERAQAAYQFELQADRLSLSVQKRLGNFRYVIHDEIKGCDLTAMVLVTSFDFFEHRLNRTRHTVDLLIVATHNSVVPLPVISLNDSKEYLPGQAPSLNRGDRRRRNRNESLLLISMLILGTDAGKETLKDMPLRTQQWYLQRAREYLKPRRGRPVAS